MVALWRSTRTRKASRSPASVRSMAMASAARTLSTLSFIRILRQVFSLAVRSAPPPLAQFAFTNRWKLLASAVGWPILAVFARVGLFCGISLSNPPTRKSRGGLKYRIITVDLRAEPRCVDQYQELKLDPTIHPRADGRDLVRCQ